MNDRTTIAVLIAEICAEAGVTADEVPTITLIEVAVRLMMRRQQARTVVAEPPCPFGDS